MSEVIRKIFDGIPVAALLAIAAETHTNLQSVTSATDSRVSWHKDATEIVTEADLQMQECLLSHFANSALAGSYSIKAEEEVPDAYQLPAADTANMQWQLLIDPLDGTSSFCRGEETWGTMVGLCDRQGLLVYSWNMVSGGQQYSTWSAHTAESHLGWSGKSEIRIDVYDYGAGVAERFPEQLERVSAGQCSAAQVTVSSLPAAVAAGLALFEKRLDGLLWLPSDQGKKVYPDYDLVFLGALREQGWHVVLGTTALGVELVAVAANQEQADLLWQTGLHLLPAKHAEMLQRKTELQITSAV